MATTFITLRCSAKFIFFSYFFILFFNFTILYWFCHISTWICHRYTCVPHPKPSSLFPPHTISLGRPSAPAPSIQYCSSNLDGRLISYMILYMFQCHSPKSSHHLPLPESKRLFYTSVSLLLSCIQGYHYHLSKSSLSIHLLIGHFRLFPYMCYYCIMLQMNMGVWIPLWDPVFISFR